MLYDHNKITGTNGSRAESSKQRRTNKATTKACEDQDAPKEVWQLASQANTTTLLLDVTLNAYENADGGKWNMCNYLVS
jgi:hypothetical protein